MKTVRIIIYILFYFTVVHSSSAQIGIALSGTVTEKKSGAPLTGVTIYINELKRGTITNNNGMYRIDNLPETKVVVQVTFVGYKRINETIDLSQIVVKNFVLEESVAELSEIVITGLSQAGERNRTPTSITMIPSLEIQQNTSANIIDALSMKPGINQITTGTGISKPIIRGLGYNRVVVVNDGIRQEGQQWGDEHGIELDENAVNSVEILKGPASLMYGSDAMAGVINFISAPTLPEGMMEAKLISNYHTNNGLLGYSANVAGNKKNFIWNLRWSDKISHAYQNKYDGYVFNSGFKEKGLNGILGINRAWGFSHIHFSWYEMKPGIVEGERDSLTGHFTKPVMLNDSTAGTLPASNSDFKDYDLFIPYQKVNHYKVVLNNNFIVNEGSLKLITGWQQNQRNEFGDVFNSEQFGLYFLLNTLNYDVRYVFAERNNLHLSTGINGMYQSSQNKGSEFLVPAYNLFDAGVYVTAHKSINRFDISGGLRFDHRSQVGDELFLSEEGIPVNESDSDAITKFTGFDKKFEGISGALGMTYQISEILYTKLNVARGFRAPNIAELGSNGEHEGTIRYEIGNVNLKAENSTQFDFTFGINSSHITGELNLFSNYIDNFIYLTKISNVLGGDSLIDELAVFNYTAGSANLSGGEINIDIHPHPLDWLHFENSFAYVTARNLDEPDGEKYLPFTPAPKLTSLIKANAKSLSKFSKNAFVKFGIDYYFEQNQIYSLNNTETPTPAYILLNFGIGTDVVVKNRSIFTFYMNINNFLDEAYQSHLSRLKYAPENYATGRSGVYDMGRNISFKLIIPFSIKLEKAQN